jgi:hypothetical protein
MSNHAAIAPMPPNMTDAGAFTPHPSDLLIDLVAALLTPMFIGTTRGDPRIARLAALETVHAYQVANQVDLLNVLQIIALGLASAQAACLSLTPDLPIAQVTRLFSHADRLNRSGMARSRFREQERRQSPRAPAPKERPAIEAKTLAPSPVAAKPAAPASPTATPNPQPGAAAFAELTALLHPDRSFDPIAQPAKARQEATLRAKALNGVARNLLDGVPMQTAPLIAPFKLVADVGQR